MLKDIYEEVIKKGDRKVAWEYPSIDLNDPKYIELVTKIIRGEYVCVKFNAEEKCKNPLEFFKQFSNGYIKVGSKDGIEYTEIEMGINKPEKLEKLLKDEEKFIQSETLRLA